MPHPPDTRQTDPHFSRSRNQAQTQPNSSGSNKHHPRAHSSPTLLHKPWGPFPETSTNTSSPRVLLKCFFNAVSLLRKTLSLPPSRNIPPSPPVPGPFISMLDATALQSRVLHLTSSKHLPSQDHCLHPPPPPHSSTPPKLEFRLCSSSIQAPRASPGPVHASTPGTPHPTPDSHTCRPPQSFLLEERAYIFLLGTRPRPLLIPSPHITAIFQSPPPPSPVQTLQNTPGPRLPDFLSPLRPVPRSTHSRSRRLPSFPDAPPSPTRSPSGSTSNPHLVRDGVGRPSVPFRLLLTPNESPPTPSPPTTLC